MLCKNKDKWFEDWLEPETDWIKAYEERFRMVGRYEYVFHKENLEPFEMAIKWLCKLKGYPYPLNDEVSREYLMREVEDWIDRMLVAERIPLRMVDEMREMVHPPKRYRSYHPNYLDNGDCAKCGEPYIYCGCETVIKFVEVDRNGKEKIN